jgi:hypothetical protein
MGESSLSDENIPGHFQHMLKETGNNIRLLCLVIKRDELLEVCGEFRLVCCCSERDVDVFTCLPLVKTVFHLKKKDEGVP